MIARCSKIDGKYLIEISAEDNKEAQIIKTIGVRSGLTDGTARVVDKDMMQYIGDTDDGIKYGLKIWLGKDVTEERELNIGDVVYVDLKKDFKDGKVKITGKIVEIESEDAMVVDLGKIKCARRQIEKVVK